jgi:hypothetical protein
LELGKQPTRVLYEKIPEADRATIERDWKAQRGSKPHKSEVENVYTQWKLKPFIRFNK